MSYNFTEQAKKLYELTQELIGEITADSITAIAPSGYVDYFSFAITVFVLSCFIGYYVVWKVTPALHTPLMSLTNAISSIIIVGGISTAGVEHFDIAAIFGFFAIFLASVNLFGGFMITKRTLDMFQKKKQI